MMQFKVFFTATGSTMIEADRQADAEGKSENLSDEQVAEGIDSVEIVDVAKVVDTDDAHDTDDGDDTDDADDGDE